MNATIYKVLHHPARDPILAGLVGFGLGYLFGRRNKVIAHTIPVQESWPKIITDKQLPKDMLLVVTDVETEDEEELTSREYIDQAVAMAEERELQEVELHPNGAYFAGTDMDAEWNYEEELAKRTETEPYILHRDEFYSDEMNFSQTTLTYYAGDDIMCDQDDKPVYNHVNTTGPLLFGHGSDDPNIFYVRNTKLRAEYEIVFDPGLYSEVVLGLEIEQNDRAQNLKHSHAIHKFKQE